MLKWGGQSPHRYRAGRRRFLGIPMMRITLGVGFPRHDVARRLARAVFRTQLAVLATRLAQTRGTHALALEPDEEEA